MDEILTRGWGIILPWCGGTSTSSQKATLAARWLREPQPLSNQLVGLGFPFLRGGIDPGDLRFRPRG